MGPKGQQQAVGFLLALSGTPVDQIFGSLNLCLPARERVGMSFPGVGNEPVMGIPFKETRGDGYRAPSLILLANFGFTCVPQTPWTIGAWSSAFDHASFRPEVGLGRCPQCHNFRMRAIPAIQGIYLYI